MGMQLKHQPREVDVPAQQSLTIFTKPSSLKFKLNNTSSTVLFRCLLLFLSLLSVSCKLSAHSGTDVSHSLFRKKFVEIHYPFLTMAKSHIGNQNRYQMASFFQLTLLKTAP